MSSEPVVSKPSKQNSLLQRKQNIPVRLTEESNFDDSFAFMREQFHEEMKRIEQEMHKFSVDLKQYMNARPTTVQTSLVTTMPESMTSHWQDIQNSPLVTGEENEKTLKLQFDVSQFEPTEIKVKLINDLLIISANHEEITNDSTVYREYSRQFKLPPDTDPELVVSSLSRDGVLTVEAPLTQPAYNCIMSSDA